MITTVYKPKRIVKTHESGGRDDQLAIKALNTHGMSYQAYYSEVWKAHHKGKDLTEARSLQRKLEPGTVGPDKIKRTSLRGIANRAKTRKHHRFRDLYRLLNAEFLLESWQDLNKKSASGVDKVTANDYKEHLVENIQKLAKRLKTKRYRAKLVRRCYIPKENGLKRPLGIPALEDKLVQIACSKILTAIYEEDFLDFSNAYRPNRSAKETIGDLAFNLQYGRYGYIVEADIKGFFCNMEHDWILKMLALRIEDRAFLKLIRKWLKAGILDTDGQIIDPETGTPQGGIVSPILANVYLHYALDLWFEKIVKKHCHGEAIICRYADDFVCAFRYKDDAERFYRTLPKRLEKFSLEVAPEKTQIIRFCRFKPSMTRSFTFLGFELYWLKDYKGIVRVMRRTARKKLQGACRRIKEWIKENRHMEGQSFIKGLNRRLRGHYNYYGLRGNFKSLKYFYEWAIESTFKWLNRRGGKRKSFTWAAFTRALKRVGVALPMITEKQQQHRVFT